MNALNLIHKALDEKQSILIKCNGGDYAGRTLEIFPKKITISKVYATIRYSDEAVVLKLEFIEVNGQKVDLSFKKEIDNAIKRFWNTGNNAIKIIYHDGSSPGAIRTIYPAERDDNYVLADTEKKDDFDRELLKKFVISKME